MASFGRTFRHPVLALLIAAFCLRIAGDHSTVAMHAPRPFSSLMPPTVLWAWEEPEDLRAAPVADVGVACLAETLLLGTNTSGQPAVAVVHRRQPLAVAPGAAVMAVVRVVIRPGFRDSSEMREQTAAALAQVSRQPGLRALQIDFDATRSQRAFYADVLRQLRPRMPAGMPLSITALLSWCETTPGTSWLAGLPIDEAVPMFFRLGGSARPGDSKLGYPLRERLCRGSVGISTDESWPAIDPEQRVYLFAPRPWTPDQLAATANVHHGHPRALAFNPYVTPRNDTGLHGADFDRLQPPGENLP
jgi:hypothetical protein